MDLDQSEVGAADAERAANDGRLPPAPVLSKEGLGAVAADTLPPLAQEIADFIDLDPADATDGEFNRLALALFARQYALVAPYRRLCDSLERTPATVERWEDIPAVPAAAFKQFALSCAPIEEAVVVFHSSGTTGPETSKHYMDATALALYDRSLRRGFDLALGPDRPRTIWAVMPPPSEAPHSSLSYMLGSLGAERFYWDKNEELASALREVTQPIVLFSTAFALAALFEASEEVWALPVGSILMETGGFKGRHRELDVVRFRSDISSRFALPADSVWSEYGMSEMASQLYGHGSFAAKRPPHWLRPRLFDPSSRVFAEPSDGPGGDPQGQFVQADLANWNSVLAVETQDIGAWAWGGSIILMGRAPDAPFRGCSLMAEDLPR